jgi:hypothetical protein
MGFNDHSRRTFMIQGTVRTPEALIATPPSTAGHRQPEEISEQK